MLITTTIKCLSLQQQMLWKCLSLQQSSSALKVNFMNNIDKTHKVHIKVSDNSKQIFSGIQTIYGGFVAKNVEK